MLKVFKGLVKIGKSDTVRKTRSPVSLFPYSELSMKLMSKFLSF